MANHEAYTDLAAKYLPPDWDDAPSRREQILTVIGNFLDTPADLPTKERRLRAQKQAADAFGVQFNTIQSKCGRETYADHVASSDDYQREHFDTALENIEAALQSEIQPNDETTDKSVWIEKTEIEGRTYKKEGELELGNAIYSPSQDKQGHDRYAQMREAAPGDIVLHLLQDKERIVGISTIESELETDFEGLPEFGWTDEQAGYRRWLTNYQELDEPVHIYDDILANRTYESQLRTIRDEYSNLFYDKNLTLVQGGYFTQCPPELLAIFTDASTALQDALAAHEYPIVELPSIGMEPAEEYDSLDDALADIQDRLQQTQQGTDWIQKVVGHAVIAVWSAALAGFEPSDEVSEATAAKFDQLRDIYESVELEFSNKADELGVGTLDGFDPATTLFLTSFRLRQDDLGIQQGLLNQSRLNSILTQSYTVQDAGPDHPPEPVVEHPLLDQLEASESPVHKFTAPPDYWLMALQYGAVTIEDEHKSTWDAIDAGELAILHTRSDPSDSDLPAQPHGIFAVGILGPKTTKDARWWRDESDADPHQYVVSFDRLFVTSDLEKLDMSTPLAKQSTETLGQQLEALTDGLLPYDRVEELCLEATGDGFPAQGAHGVFRSTDQSLDHARPRALIEALADRLQETSTIHAHTDFTGELSTEPLDGLYFPDDTATEIIDQIETALRTGKHIILTGPPGTGKTEIARRVCDSLATQYPYLYSDFQLTTATADWSTFDTVGGYMPDNAADTDDALSFTPGIVLNRLKDRHTGRQRNEPLIIDELNRADIDKAFGQLFTLLSGQSVQLPYTRDSNEIELVTAAEQPHRAKPHQYKIPDSWRIFATMNSYDKTSLYEMSYAFMRRFAFIRVGAPDLPAEDPELTGLMRSYAEVWDLDPTETTLLAVGRVWRAMNTAVSDRAIGPAIVEDILAAVTDQPDQLLETRLTRAIISYIFPQLEGVPKRGQIIRQIADSDAPLNEVMLADAGQEMLQVDIMTDG
jgi:MoxR-like ATPase